MARPWRKKWPYVTARGRKSYQLGFRDHDGVERTKSFSSAKLANQWTEAYAASERRGIDSLKRFLLDLDAKEASEKMPGKSTGEVIQLYFAFNAPEAADGLAKSTFHTYRHSANRHLLGLASTNGKRKVAPAAYAVQFAPQPAISFNEPAAPRVLREAMKHAKAGPSACAHAWRVLSAALSWAAGSALVPEVQSNGCLLANERVSSRRKSIRGTRHSIARRHGDEVLSWGLSPMTIELLRAEMLNGPMHKGRPVLAQRDAVIVSLQFGLALRNQEVYGMCWSSFGSGQRAHVTQVDELDDWGETTNATGRTIKTIPGLLRRGLQAWRTLLRQHGYPATDTDFVIPGNLAGPDFGTVDSESGACHMSGNQAKKWRPRCMTPAVDTLADKAIDNARVHGATPYGLRRGGISTRLRSEDAQAVASQCGTSLECCLSITATRSMTTGTSDPSHWSIYGEPRDYAAGQSRDRKPVRQPVLPLWLGGGTGPEVIEKHAQPGGRATTRVAISLITRSSVSSSVRMESRTDDLRVGNWPRREIV